MIVERGQGKGEERIEGSCLYIYEVKSALPNRSKEWRKTEFVWFHTMNNVYFAALVTDANGHKVLPCSMFPYFYLMILILIECSPSSYRNVNV